MDAACSILCALTIILLADVCCSCTLSSMSTCNPSDVPVAADHPQGDCLLATNTKSANVSAASSTQLNLTSATGSVIVIVSAAFLFFFLWLYYVCCADARTLHRGRSGRLVQLRQRGLRRMATEPPRPSPPLPLLPVASCHAADGTASADCVICLSEFEDKEEMVKVIPRCRHVFHPQCIDRWLLSHGSCPVCRCTELFAPRGDHSVSTPVAGAV